MQENEPWNAVSLAFTPRWLEAALRRLLPFVSKIALHPSPLLACHGIQQGWQVLSTQLEVTIHSPAARQDHSTWEFAYESPF